MLPASDTSQNSESTGRAFGDYLLINEIARGAMGVVYRAHQRSLGREVALKMILAGAAATSEQIRRFRREAETAARVRHRGIVPIFEVGEVNQQHYFTMALIDGPSLADFVRKGPMTPPRAATIARDIAETVAAAHAQGIVHRDLKPANILLTAQDEVWVTDFGLSKLVDPAIGASLSQDIVGTPAYMAPEQASGHIRSIGPATDIYGIGAILYALLTGRPPHVAPNSVSTMRAVVEEAAPAVRIFNFDVDPALETIIEKCLSKDPRRRYASATLLAADLENWLNNRPIQARPAGALERIGMWVRRKPTVALLVTLLALTLCIGLCLLVWGWHTTLDALDQARAANIARLRSDVQALATVNSDALADTLKRVSSETDQVRGLLLETLANSATSSTARARLRLALVMEDPSLFEDLAKDMVSASSVRESNALREGIFLAVQAHGEPYVQRIREAWMQCYVDPFCPVESRLLAAAAGALAGANIQLDPDMERWAADKLTADNPIDLGDWLRALTPLAKPLTPILKTRLENTELTSTSRRTAAAVFTQFSEGQADVFADAFFAADDITFGPLLSGSKRHMFTLTNQARRILKSKVDGFRNTRPQKLFPLVNAELLYSLKNFDGFLGSEGGYFAKMPREKLESFIVNARLAGFEIIRLRPYWVRTQVFFSGVLLRTHQISEILFNSSRINLIEVLTQRLEDGWYVEDLAMSLPPGEEFDDYVEHIAVVRRKSEFDRPQVVFVGEPQESIRDALSEYYTNGFTPQILTVAVSSGGQRYVSFVARQSMLLQDAFTASAVTSVEYALGESHHGLLQEDVHLLHLPDAGGVSALAAELSYSLTAAPQKNTSSKAVPACPAPDHRLIATQLISEGWNIRSIGAAASMDGVPWVTSVWHRPVVSEFELDGFAGQSANALLYLSSHGETAPLLESLRRQPESRIRSYLIGRLPLVHGSRGLLALFSQAKDSETRAALIMALGLTQHENEPTTDDSVINAGLRRIASTSDDLEERAAAEWLLRRWDLENYGTAEETQAAPVNWFDGPNGHRFVRVHAPIEFTIGSPASEPGRLHSETQHRRRISRSYAIADREVTVAQFRRFLAEQQPRRFGTISLELGNDDEPVGGVSFFMALHYCQWLSEREGLPAEEHSVLRLNPAEQEFELAPDYTRRLGYRLPTEGEWEYAARAGTTTPRFYGFDHQILGRYAFHANSVEKHAAPSAWRLPNPWGLFDIYGNVWEWCVSDYVPYIDIISSRAVLDENMTTTLRDPIGAIRGGSFDSDVSSFRSAARHGSARRAANPSLGFRIVRTLRE